jgi:hypothetical protein
VIWEYSRVSCSFNIYIFSFLSFYYVFLLFFVFYFPLFFLFFSPPHMCRIPVGQKITTLSPHTVIVCSYSSIPAHTKHVFFKGMILMPMKYKHFLLPSHTLLLKVTLICQLKNSLQNSLSSQLEIVSTCHLIITSLQHSLNLLLEIHSINQL